jgi:hypothetical protein
LPWEGSAIGTCDAGDAAAKRAGGSSAIATSTGGRAAVAAAVPSSFLQFSLQHRVWAMRTAGAVGATLLTDLCSTSRKSG